LIGDKLRKKRSQN